MSVLRPIVGAQTEKPINAQTEACWPAYLTALPHAEEATLPVTVQYVVRRTQQRQVAQFQRGGR